MMLFRSQDERFCVQIGDRPLRAMLRHCQDAGEHETGGILVGRYTADLECAVLTDVGGPPSDSKAARTWFVRGVNEVRVWLVTLWNRHTREYYLGEWHFHPFALPRASEDDKEQLALISKDAAYHCPEPIMVILGGDPRSSWRVSVYVMANGRLAALGQR